MRIQNNSLAQNYEPNPDIGSCKPRASARGYGGADA
jgi:hypothetical protein